MTTEKRPPTDLETSEVLVLALKDMIGKRGAPFIMINSQIQFVLQGSSFGGAPSEEGGDYQTTAIGFQVNNPEAQFEAEEEEEPEEI